MSTILHGQPCAGRNRPDGRESPLHCQDWLPEQASGFMQRCCRDNRRATGKIVAVGIRDDEIQVGNIEYLY
jgi:hypothetical protein